MKVQNMSLHKMRNDSHYQYHTEFVDNVNKIGAENLGISAKYTRYLAKYNEVDAAFKRVMASGYTKRIHDADKARDRVWKCLVAMITVINKWHYDPLKQEAARMLTLLIKTYGKIEKKPMHEQTSATHNILQDLDGAYAAHINTLGLSAMVVELRRCNSEVDNLTKERFEETAARNVTVLRKARAELDELYYDIIEDINAHITLEGIGEYEAFVKTQNAVIAKYKSYSHKHYGAHHHHSHTGSGEVAAPDTEGGDNQSGESEFTAED